MKPYCCTSHSGMSLFFRVKEDSIPRILKNLLYTSFWFYHGIVCPFVFYLSFLFLFSTEWNSCNGMTIYAVIMYINWKQASVHNENHKPGWVALWFSRYDSKDKEIILYKKVNSICHVNAEQPSIWNNTYSRNESHSGTMWIALLTSLSTSYVFGKNKAGFLLSVYDLQVQHSWKGGYSW